MVENVEKGVLRTLLVAGELLYVVDYQHVYHLVEVDEIVHLLVQNGRCVLCLEFVHGDVEHLQIRVALFYLHSYRLGYMRFT